VKKLIGATILALCITTTACNACVTVNVATDTYNIDPSGCVNR